MISGLRATLIDEDSIDFGKGRLVGAHSIYGTFSGQFYSDARLKRGPILWKNSMPAPGILEKNIPEGLDNCLRAEERKKSEKIRNRGPNSVPDFSFFHKYDVFFEKSVTEELDSDIT